MSSLGIFNKETQSYQKIAGSTGTAMLDTEMSDTSVNPVQNKVIKKYVDSKQVEVDVASKDKVGIVKPADGLIVAEDGTLKVNLDGTTLTMDQVNNVIKLADTLKEKISGALPAANVVNNLTTTEAGFALDARQANPNVNGTLAKQLSGLNLMVNNVGFKDVSDKLDATHITGNMAAINVGKIVMLYFDVRTAAKSDNVTILPPGTIPNSYVYAYHTVNTWGQASIPDSLMAVRHDGSLALWCAEESVGTRIFDSFIYVSV